MTNLTPLYSSTGQPAEGENKYFHREKIVNKILRKLDNGENILISAPRRIGKSSILKYLKANPKNNQIIKYIIVQSVDSSDEFFKKLFNELIEDKEIFEGASSYIQNLKSNVKHYLSRITSFSLSGKINLDKDEKIDYYQECTDLIKSFKTQKSIYIFIDEFPDALNNIRKKDESEAIKFLQKNRELRQLFSSEKISFLYTGSTGLENIVKRLEKLDLINDISTIKVPILENEEAKELIQRLVLGFQKYIKEFEIESEVLDYILERITWKIPYYMQIVIEELFDYYEDKEKSVSKKTVNLVLQNIVKSKSKHMDYFENWKKRLKDNLKNNEYAFAIEVLNHISKNELIEYGVLYDMSVPYEVDDFKYILNVLEHDGYISEDDKKYGFNSILLKEWWYINVAT